MIRFRKPPRLLVFVPAAAIAGGVAGVVFGAERRGRRDKLALGLGLSLLAYGALGAWAATRSPRPSSATPAPAEMSVELLAEARPAAPPEQRERAVLRPPGHAARQPEALAAPRPAPAQAAEVVARVTAPDEPVDLTSFSIATGGAARFGGGETASGGTNDHAVSGAVAEGIGRAPAADLSRPVAISETEWNDCAWPAEADALGIDQQSVSMRALAAADGRFESAELVSDPGHGFGAALLACARRHGFVPALDRDGRPVRARSGVIRFTFTR